MQFFHSHVSRCGAQCVDEFTFYQFPQLIGLHGAQAQGARSSCNRLGIGHHAHIELGNHIDAHAVFGDQPLVAAARHFEAQGVHVDRNHVVHDGQHKRTPVEHHLLPAHTGAYKGALFGATQVQPVQQPDNDGNHRRQGDQVQDKTSKLSAGHCISPVDTCPVIASRNRVFICWVGGCVVC